MSQPLQAKQKSRKNQNKKKQHASVKEMVSQKPEQTVSDIPGKMSQELQTEQQLHFPKLKLSKKEKKKNAQIKKANVEKQEVGAPLLQSKIEHHSAKIPVTLNENFVNLYDDLGHVGVGFLVSHNRFIATGHGRFLLVKYAQQKGKAKAECKLILTLDHYLDNLLVYEINTTFKYVAYDIGSPDNCFTAIIMGPSTVAEAVVNKVLDGKKAHLQYSYPSEPGDCGHVIFDSNKRTLVGMNCGILTQTDKKKQTASKVAISVVFDANLASKIKDF